MAVATTITPEDSHRCLLVASLWEESQKKGTLWKRTDKGKAVEGTCPSPAVSYAGSQAVRPGAAVFQQCFHCQQRMPQLPRSLTSFWLSLGFFRGKRQGAAMNRFQKVGDWALNSGLRGASLRCSESRSASAGSP